MRNLLIAKRYAKALLSMVSSENKKNFIEEVRLLKKIILNEKELFDFLNSKIIKSSNKIELVNSIIEQFPNKNLWKEFFQLLIKKQRQDILPEILDLMEVQILSEENIVKVNVRVAKKHNKETLDKISNYIKDFLKKEIEINEIIDPKIIGGFIAKSDKYLIDCSIRHNLEKLQTVLKN